MGSRGVWSFREQPASPGLFIVHRHNVAVGVLIVNPQSIPLGVGALRAVVRDMERAANNPKIVDAIAAAEER